MIKLLKKNYLYKIFFKYESSDLFQMSKYM